MLIRPGQAIEFHHYPSRVDANNHTNGEVRSGTVWSDAHVNGHAWIVPDQRRDHEGGAILVRLRKTGPLAGHHYLVADTYEYRTLSSRDWQGGTP